MPGRLTDRGHLPAAFRRTSSHAGAETDKPVARGADAQRDDRSRQPPGTLSSPVLAGLVLVCGVGLAVLGCLTVLDVLSVRSVLNASGPHVARPAATDLHARIAHSGAQVTEFGLALAGIMLAAGSIRRLLRAANS
jgi:hypothetical protein